MPHAPPLTTLARNLLLTFVVTFVFHSSVAQAQSSPDEIMKTTAVRDSIAMFEGVQAAASDKRASMSDSARRAYYKIAEVLEKNPSWKDVQLSTKAGDFTLSGVQTAMAEVFIVVAPEMKRSLPVYEQLRAGGESLDHVSIVNAGAKSQACANDMARFIRGDRELAELEFTLAGGKTTATKIQALCRQAAEAARKPMEGCGLVKLKLVSNVRGKKVAAPTVMAANLGSWYAYPCSAKPKTKGLPKDLKRFKKLPKQAQKACPKGSKAYFHTGWVREKKDVMGQVVERSAFAQCWFEGTSTKWLPTSRDREP